MGKNIAKNNQQRIPRQYEQSSSAGPPGAKEPGNTVPIQHIQMQWVQQDMPTGSKKAATAPAMKENSKFPLNLQETLLQA